MRAIRVHEFGNLNTAVLEQVADPEVGPADVLLEVKAAPVNYVDLVTFEGRYQFVPKLPYAPGKGPAGVVKAVGSSVEDFAPGDRVLAMAEYGGHAELVTADHKQVHRLPDQLSFVDAAGMSLAYDTAWMALRERARFTQGESVLVLGGSGAVGQAAVQLSKALGAGQVLAGVSRAGRPAGPADATVDLSQPDLRNSLREQVLAATDGKGVDIIIDPIGGDAFDGAIRALAWRGRCVIVGFAAGRIPTLRMNYPLLKNIEVSGLQISDYRKRIPELVKECYQEIFELYARGLLQPAESRTLPLAEWSTVFGELASGASMPRTVLIP